MAINDSKSTRVKAADAKRAFAESPDLSARFLAGLTDREGLKGLMVFHFVGGAPAHYNAFSWDGAGLNVLDEYARNTRDLFLPEALRRIGVIILAIRSDGVIDVATWGKSNDHCAYLGTLGAILLKNLPVCPFQTWFGWGNAGVPKQMSAARRSDLGSNTLAWVDRNTHPDAV